MCGVDFLEESCSTIASLVLNILEPSDFRLKDKTPQGMLLEVERTESKKTLNAQCSAGENKAGRFASFKTVLCSLSELEVIKWAIWQKSSFYHSEACLAMILHSIDGIQFLWQKSGCKGSS